MALPLRAMWMATIAATAFVQRGEGAYASNLGTVGSTAVCYGFEEDWQLCNKEKCNSCTPSNCSWSEWSDWTDMGGCIGLCNRARTIKQPNKCDGKPCEGPKYDTKECLSDAYKTNCLEHKKNCGISDWTTWSLCGSSMAQQYSERALYQHPIDGGTPCTADIKRTKPCAAKGTGDSHGELDCKFSKWADWTGCSRACDGGHKSRTRRVTAETKYGGSGCNGSISQTHQCNAQYCAHTRDCKFSRWSTWSECNSAASNSPFESYRTRDIDTPASGAGQPCKGEVKEAKGCDNPTAKDCEFDDWQAWSKCTTTCGGGQKYRNRHLKNAAKNGGSCISKNMQETHGCNSDACPTACTYTKWSKWSKCSPRCGAGIMTRHRSVDGQDCQGPIKLVKNCTTECDKTDCKWSDWGNWSACSLPCGSGTHTRARQITQTPAHGGKECMPLTTSEIGACNSNACGADCIDGQWGKWSAWSKCSVTCQTGYQTRTRQITTQPNHCGKPAGGLTVEVQTCEGKDECVPSTNCELSEWSTWGECQRDCFGIQEQTRQIETYAKGFYGKPCQNSTLKVVRACNPAKEEKTPAACQAGVKSVDCELGHWAPWSKCSLPCGPGQKTRVRSVDQFPEGEGKPCNAALKETDSCQAKECEEPACVNCKWGAWGEWGQCQGLCEGQTTRHRSIAQFANWCGTNCSMSSAMQTTRCEGNCPKNVFCTWGEWETTSECDPDGCGPRTSRDRRSLKIVNKYSHPAPLANGTVKMLCHGDDRKISTCPYKSCAPPKVDCVFAEWGKWSAPSCSQLCERVRDMKTQNRNGGKACDGALRMTKECKKDCEKPVDCKLASWSDWSKCGWAKNGQSYRTRAISQGMKFGGKLCHGRLEESKWCTAIKKPVNCELNDWASWGECSVSCGGGIRMRARFIKTQVAYGGKACNSTVEQMDSCANDNCENNQKPVACVFFDWSEWKNDALTAQKKRSRTIKTHPKYNGTACTGSLEEMQPIDPIDCDMSDWGSWDKCDRSCENGQTQRKRQVNTHPRFGGKQCEYPLNLLEVKGCTGEDIDKKCDSSNHDAATSDWTKWSKCTVTCGPGQQTRDRKLQSERGALGVGFTGELKQTRRCTDVDGCDRTDCKWHKWSKWSDCTKNCGGGQQTRSRAIAQAPEHRGAACEPLSGEEAQACNVQECKEHGCKDGAWNKWSEWGSCSSSCLGGVQYRHRTVKQVANSCGKPIEGTDRMYQSCNSQTVCADTDCKLGDWNEWYACSRNCDGVANRQRSIKTLGFGKGAYCTGGLSELRTCNPSSKTKGCIPVVKTDCEWSSWNVKPCTSTCGRGDIVKSRSIEVAAAFGGKPCNGHVTEVYPCKDNKPCPKPKPIDCAWAEWSVWSACDKCGGQRKRFREISKPPQHDGKACDSTEISQTEGCDGKEFCTKTYCIWARWSSWGSCSKKCGTGKRMRRRQLKESITPADDDKDNAKSKRLFNTYQELQKQLEDKSGEKWQVLVVAFGGGCMSFIVLASAMRFFNGRSRQSDCEAAPIEDSTVAQEYPTDAYGYSELEMMNPSDTGVSWNE